MVFLTRVSKESWLLLTSLVLLSVFTGCCDDDHRKARELKLTLDAPSVPAVEFACMDFTPSRSGSIELVVENAAPAGVEFYFRIGEEGEWYPSSQFEGGEEGAEGLLFTWDTSSEDELQGDRVEDVYVQVREGDNVSEILGPFTIDNSVVPEITECEVLGDYPFRGDVRVVATVAAGTAFIAELGFSINGGSFQCAEVAESNPDEFPSGGEIEFLWDSQTDVPESLSGPVDVTLRVLVLSGRFDPEKGICERTITVDNRSAPALSIATDSISTFSTKSRFAELVKGNNSYSYSSVLLETDPLLLSAFPGYGRVEPNAFVKVEASDASITYLANQSGSFDPPPSIPKKNPPGTIIPAKDYTFSPYSGAEPQERKTPPLLVGTAEVNILGEPEQAQILYVLDPEMPAQETLDLTGNTFGLPNKYPYVPFADTYPGPDGGLPAISGIQVFGKDSGLAGLLKVDPESGKLEQEISLAAQTPRTGLQGGAHQGTVTVWTLDDRSGEPLPGTSVLLSQNGNSWQKRTGVQGKAEFTGLAPDTQYSVSAGGRALTSFSVIKAKAKYVVLPLEKEERPENELSLGAKELESSGESEITMPLYATSKSDIVGFQLAFLFEPASEIEPAGSLDCDSWSAPDCAVQFFPPDAWGQNWEDRVLYMQFDYDQSEGGLVAGAVLDNFQQGAVLNELPAGLLSRYHLLDLKLQVDASAPWEGIVRLANGMEIGGSTPVAKFNELTSLGEEYQVEPIRPHGKAGLIASQGGLPEVEKLPEDGGNLYSETLFSFEDKTGEEEEFYVTGKFDSTTESEPPRIVVATERSGMLSDVFANKEDSTPTKRITKRSSAFGSPDPVSARMQFSVKQAVDLQVGAIFLTGPGEKEVSWLSEFEWSEATCNCTVPQGFPPDYTVYKEGRVFGPSGLTGSYSFSWEGPEELPVSGPSFQCGDEFPKIWDLPAGLLTHIVGSDGHSSTVYCWLNTTKTDGAECSKSFLMPPELIDPPASTDLTETLPQTVQLSWNPVEGASCYLVEFREYAQEKQGAAVLWRIFVPEAGQEVIEVTLPELPPTASLLKHVPYTWSVTAISNEEGSSSVTPTHSDYLELIVQTDRTSSSEKRAIVWE